MLRQTPLHELHEALGARMVDFAGWSMPVQYGSIVEEHRAVRTKAGLFDLGHMGRIEVRGPKRIEFLDRHLTNRYDDAETGDARYALLTNERGTILDDVIAYILADRALVVVNASNREKALSWLEARANPSEVLLRDLSTSMMMLAVQGPESRACLRPLTDVDIDGLGYYRVAEGRFLDEPALVARTGYTGEDGFEVYFDAELSKKAWSALLESGRPALRPIGLGARDTLRLEAAMPLYGHEIDEETNPLEAGLAFAVELDKPKGFVGAEALAAVKREGPRRRLRCIEVDGKRIPRQGCALHAPDGRLVGAVTSGTFSPWLEKAICMGYVAKGADAIGSELEVDIRGSRSRARIVERPFYKRER